MLVADDGSSSSTGVEEAEQPLKKAKPPKPPKKPSAHDDPDLPEGLRSSSYRLDHHDKVQSEPGSHLCISTAAA